MVKFHNITCHVIITLDLTNSTLQVSDLLDQSQEEIAKNQTTEEMDYAVPYLIFYIIFLAFLTAFALMSPRPMEGKPC